MEPISCKGSCPHSLNTAQLGVVLFTPSTPLRKHIRAVWRGLSNSEFDGQWVTALIHESCAPDLASIHTGGDSVALANQRRACGLSIKWGSWTRMLKSFLYQLCCKER